MNVYIVVEGKTEKPVYKTWIPFVNNRLIYVNDIFEIQDNNFSIVSGEGYPGYYDIIENAIEDVNAIRNVDRLVISIDSEDKSREEKQEEVSEFLLGRNCFVPITIIVQHFCIETWALGNRKIVRRHPVTEKLVKYKRAFDVLVNDPEMLPGLPDEDLNRAQLAFRYLKAIMNERFRNLTYTKKNPKPLLHIRYFLEVKSRLEDTGHIGSFGDFLQGFN